MRRDATRCKLVERLFSAKDLSIKMDTGVKVVNKTYEKTTGKQDITVR